MFIRTLPGSSRWFNNYISNILPVFLIICLKSAKSLLAIVYINRCIVFPVKSPESLIYGTKVNPWLGEDAHLTAAMGHEPPRQPLACGSLGRTEWRVFCSPVALPAALLGRCVSLEVGEGAQSQVRAGSSGGSPKSLSAP